jgi:hypothetical protein
MGMYDTVEIVEEIENGPTIGEYQTKSLENCLFTYYVKDRKLVQKIYKYETVPEEERTHPIFGMLRSVYLGDKDTQYHGWIDIYGVNETWKLKFTDGVLMETKLAQTHVYATDPDISTSGSLGENSQDQEVEEVAYWTGDGYVAEEDNDHYEG